MAAATASVATPPHRRLTSIHTVLNGTRLWVTLGPPSSYDSNRLLYLTPTETEATLVHFSAITDDDATDGKDIGPDGTTPCYIEFPLVSSTESGLLRPRYTPAHGTPLGTATASWLGEGPTPITWIRTAPHDTGTKYMPHFSIRLATEPNLAISSSHEVGLRLKEEPFGVLADETLTPPALFVQETLCSACESLWTSTTSGVCEFCASKEATKCSVCLMSWTVSSPHDSEEPWVCRPCATTVADMRHTEMYGAPPERPCNGCGELTPYGGFCSTACKWDTMGYAC
jgi:hypothetical protein